MITASDVLHALSYHTRIKIRRFEYLCGILDSHYGQPWRHYHTLDHVHAMLMSMYRVSPLIINLQEMEIAILFHDLIYNPLASKYTNETQSATMAIELLPNCFTDDVNDSIVFDLIMATVHDPNRELVGDENLIVDIDLHNFGQDFDTFWANGENVAREFIPLVGEEKYTPGRIAFLQGMLDRPRIFQTNVFNEIGARENCALAIAKLQGQNHA
jgi:predicted metal-dependent HD superfamily phosphohydrolase